MESDSQNDHAISIGAHPENDGFMNPPPQRTMGTTESSLPFPC